MNQRCIHCLRLTDAITGDHVVPNSWYPDNTPSTVQRSTAPSCLDCNREHGQLEKDLLIRLVLCLDPKSEAVSGLTSKALRSLGLDTERLSENEKVHRDKLRAKLRSELIPYAHVAGKPGQIPGLGPHEPTQWVVPIPWAGLSIMAEKIARGCEHKLKGRFLEKPYGIRTAVTDSAVVPELFARAAKVYDFGPGCKIRRVFATEDPNVVIYWISIWDALCFTVKIDLEEELPERRMEVEGITPQAAMRISPYLREQR